ncbi:MAG: aminopeptidase P N-terminal domain-containing protein [Gemmatimonadetes bacterium]|nr:aminopeptidase P N-terminal domain-containing protein [Gemmatimonadota bacterium]
MTELPPLPFQARREIILSRLEGGSMVLPAAPVQFMGGDSEYRYRPDSELLYATGWAAPNCVAVLRGFADEDRFVLFVPERDARAELWMGPRLDLEEVKERFGADAVHPLRQLAERGPRLIAGGDTVHYRLGASAGCDGVVREALRRGRVQRARRGAGAHVLADPGAVLDRMRVRKDEAEIARMRKAARITVEAFRDALPEVQAGAGEWEVEAALESGFRRRGAGGPAFATIVAAGANACTLHYAANGSRIEADDLVLVDAGAEYGWYAADITRTVPASGQLDGARREAHEVVQQARRAALAACRPGGTVEEVHLEASRAIAGGLVGMGVVAGPVEEVLAEGRHRDFYPHQTSHWLGLDTHDPGLYRGRDGPVRFEPGMVFTVEPGLYFAPGSCPRVPELEGTGIRIEDDVLITDNGAEVLTGGLPVGVGDGG